MSLGIPEIVAVFESKGAAWYGSERVSQLQHALQCAALAEADGAAVALVAASFLHDIGHLLVTQPHVLEQDRDDVHQYVALPLLRAVFPDAVLEPIRLHVGAKRFLCLAEPGYRAGLSEASKHSLALQGGPYSALGAERFLNQRYAADAIRLRRWDDLAKQPRRVTPPLTHYAEVLARVQTRVPAAAP